MWIFTVLKNPRKMLLEYYLKRAENRLKVLFKEEQNEV